MKPENWNELSVEEKCDYAFELMGSLRGRMLMSDALYRAAAIARNGGETSNAEDIDCIREGLFPLDWHTAKTEELALDKVCVDDDQ